jgi:hypothetical protein
MRYKQSSTDSRDAVVERLREFIRFNYVTAAEVARRIGVRDSTAQLGNCRRIHFDGKWLWAGVGIPNPISEIIL